MKRILLFLVTNIAVLVVLSVVASVLGVDRFLTEEGLSLGSLLVFSAIIGFGGSIISLLISKWMAKMSTGAHVIDGSEGTNEYWLVSTVKKLADKAQIGMPEVAIFEGAPNAFATGAFKNSALVAVSTGLLQTMDRDEVEAVLGHEVTHIANGDMVTLTLIQGVVNTFVIFLSRVIGYVVDKMIFRTERGVGPGFFIASLVSQIVLGILASMIVAWFSRRREFRADAGSADLLATPRPMINALARLGGAPRGDLPQAFEAHGVAESPSKFLGLFASHPPIAERIAALQARGQ
jgi:heat shock protein HtpX